MRQAPRFTLIWLVLMLCAASVVASPTDEDNSADYPDSRVARITVVRGDVQIRRAGSQEWEEGTLNLPLVEGDRLATGQDSRVEIQFDRDNYLRLAEDSILKIVTLNDNGVAVSLPEGILSVRLGNFKNKRDSFEIDAPDTTVAVEREGRYRIDVPQGSSSNELKVTVTDGGQARVYSETSGYTIRSGRTARVFLSGEYAGDVDFTSAINPDYFDDWVATREDAVTRSRRDEYRSYYGSDIYGADDLNDYGEWVNTGRYGRVWRPYRNSIASYDNWSPYRYGHWRYISSYGWTWIADEPWGWATSHYGRWVYLDDGWNWCPYEYGYRRHSRWQPALVVFLNFGRNICWYPLPYDSYYSYNRYSRTIVYNNTTIINNTTVINNKSPNQRIAVDRDQKPEQSRLVYTHAMNQMPLEKFGKVRGGVSSVPTEEARKIIDVNAKSGERRIVLPVYAGNTDAKVSKEREVITKRDSLAKAERELNDISSKIGAMPREKGVTLDEKLREDRVFKGRTPTVIRDDKSELKVENTKQPRTGVFDRQPGVKEKRDDNNGVKTREDVLDRPVPRQPKSSNRDDNTDRSNDRPPLKDERDNTGKPAEQRQSPRKEERNNSGDDNNRRQPSNEPLRQKEPVRRDEPRNEPPMRREESRPEPPKQRVEPRQEPPKQREEPKREEPKRETPPLSKSEKSGKDGERR
ncbi:MAG: DUF6600 domain-containing protein [Pyrinomonadaceae bacterium]